MFLQLSVILFTGGGGSGRQHLWADTALGRQPLGRQPLGRHLLSRHPTPGRCPLGRHPLRQIPPGRPLGRPPHGLTPPRQTPPMGRHPPGKCHCSVRYTSYWNAFLSVEFIPPAVCSHGIGISDPRFPLQVVISRRRVGIWR